MSMSSIEHDRIFIPYVTGAQVKFCQNDRWEDRTPTQQSQGTYSGTDMSDSKQECLTRSETPKNMIMKSSYDSMKGERKTVMLLAFYAITKILLLTLLY